MRKWWCGEDTSEREVGGREYGNVLVWFGLV